MEILFLASVRNGGITIVSTTINTFRDLCINQPKPHQSSKITTI
ncbi:hypothetical protein [uncultured Gammaproteobacteria bacterium]|nr:hypothetical protein [uncultured Gammaproteobacteria bacterium]